MIRRIAESHFAIDWMQVRIMHEVRLLEQLDHGNIISFFGSWVNRDKVTAFKIKLDKTPCLIAT